MSQKAGFDMKYIFMRYPEGKFKAVTLSYDDGQYHDVRLAQTLDKYGLKGTFNLCSKRIGQTEPSRRLTVEEVKEHLLSKGHEIAVHGEDHISPVLSRPTKAIQDQQVLQDLGMDMDQEKDQALVWYFLRHHHPRE